MGRSSEQRISMHFTLDWHLPAYIFAAYDRPEIPPKTNQPFCSCLASPLARTIS